MKFNEQKDLSRWNRAGLSEFRYVDGNAITFLETLRQQLAAEYDNDGVPIWSELVNRLPELPNESSQQKRERISEQYYDSRRDYAWEILRAFSRSSHVLAEYINAYANEAYLPSAVEWDNVRKLASMIGYQPAPPASAETHIALLFKENESGVVEEGFAVKNKPNPGDPTIVFETRDKLVGNASINKMRLNNWDKHLDHNDEELDLHFYETDDGLKADFIPNDGINGINIGDIGVLETIPAVTSVEVIDVFDESLIIKLPTSPLINPNDIPLHDTTLYLQPSFTNSPFPNGANSILTRSDVTFNENEMVFIKSEPVGAEPRWQIGRISKSDRGHILIDSPEPLTINSEDSLHRANLVQRQSHLKILGGEEIHILPSDYNSDQHNFYDESLNKILLSASTSIRTIVDGNIRYIPNIPQQRIYYPEETPISIINSVGTNTISELKFSGKIDILESSQSVLLSHPDDTVSVSTINKIKSGEFTYSLELTPNPDKAVSLLRSAFKKALKHKGYNINNAAAWDGPNGNDFTTLKLEDLSVVSHLTLGQNLIVACDKFAVLVELKNITISNGLASLDLVPPIHNHPKAHLFTANNTVIYGNVVSANHGESQPQKIVGSGDASKTNQCFDLTSKEISWVSDPAFSSGVRADLLVQVGHRLWQQVEDLSLSTPEDHHYEVRVNEDNTVSLCFGNGRVGRKLPTGIDNIRVRYRNGYGENGNIKPYSLIKVKRPHRLVENFVAPLDSAGGAEKESAKSMREQAPASVQTLGRAVSLEDFSRLTAHHSMVWQATAGEKFPNRPARSQVQIVVVLAGGATFIPGAPQAKIIHDFLAQNSPLGTSISVLSYQPLLMQLKIIVMVDETAYNKIKVKETVAEFLQTQLSLKERKLGQPLYRSEIVALLEQVEGVENSHCQINGIDGDTNNEARFQMATDGTIRKVSIKPNQLLYFDNTRIPMQISFREYVI